MIHDIKHAGIEIKFYNLDTFKKQIDVNFIDLDSELVNLDYKVVSLIFCLFWRGIQRERKVVRFSAAVCGEERCVTGEGKRSNEFAEWHMAWLAKLRNYAESTLCRMQNDL